MKRQVLVLGAGFAGLELTTRLSESLADDVDVTLVDQSDAFVFGFSKLEVLLGRQSRAQVSCPYAVLDRPGVTFRQESVRSIDPATRRVVTDASEYEPDVLVVALGADYDPGATPGFVEDGFEFYSVAGAERLRERLSTFAGGSVVLAVLGVPFKCPPAPYEGALLLHDALAGRGLSSMTVVSPMDSPVPVSPDTSAAIVEELGRRGIAYLPGHRVQSLDPVRHVAHTKDGELAYDLFIGIPVHRAPAVVTASGLTEGGTDGWVAVEPRFLTTRFPGVYALGDCADAPVPRAGVFAETAARAVADHIMGSVRGGSFPPYDGKGSCYIEFGGGLVGKVDADFLSGPSVRAPFLPPSRELAAEKAAFAASRRRRWFGLP